MAAKGKGGKERQNVNVASVKCILIRNEKTEYFLIWKKKLSHTNKKTTFFPVKNCIFAKKLRKET